MFREMRRGKQSLSEKECIALLQKATSGVLAVDGDDGYPYAVPMNYVYHDGRLLFHCAPTGHKLDAIARNEKVSFCVISQDEIVPEKFTSYFRSVIVFGKAHLITDENEKLNTLMLLAKHFSPAHVPGREGDIQKALPALHMLALDIEHMTGKEGRDLANAKHN